MKFQDKQLSIVIANRIKSIRLQKKLSRSQAAEAAGLTEAIIIAVESGITVISLDHLIAFAKGLGCSLDYLVGNVTEEVGLRGEVLKSFDTLDVEQQKLVGQFVAFIKSLGKIETKTKTRVETDEK